MKILKAYLYFYWDVLICVSMILQLTILTIGMFTFAFVSGIVLDTVKQFKWNHEINRFEGQVIDWNDEIEVRILDWYDGFLDYFIKK